MTAHQLEYFRYLIRKIKDLYIETQAMCVVLDTANGPNSTIYREWRTSVHRLQVDPVYCSAVEANMGPYFLRLEQALQDEALLEKLRASTGSELPGDQANRR